MMVAAVVAVGVSAPATAQAAGGFAWGNNGYGALGLQASSNSGVVPQPAPMALEDISGVAAGEQFALGLSNGEVYGWGANGWGQLGDGSTTNHPQPTAVAGLEGIDAVAAGPVTSFALRKDGTVAAWGANGEGQLGLGSNSGPETCGTHPCMKLPVAVPGLSQVRALAVGGSHVLALLEDGTVEAWGANNHGQLGDGTTVEKDSPVVVGAISDAVAVAAGQQFSLALLADGQVLAWGNGSVGQLGNGAMANSTTPVAVTGLGEVSAVAAGTSHALALLGNGEVRSWGGDGEGQLGDGSFGLSGNSDVPVVVDDLSGVTAVAAGGNHSFALVPGGSLEAWGGDGGQLGDGGGHVRSTVPVQVSCKLHGLEGVATGLTGTFAWGAADQRTCPSVSAVAPQEGAPGGGTEVTISGSELEAASAVDFGSTPASSFSVISNGEIQAVAPPGTETVDVTVVTPSGVSPTTTHDRYTYPGQPTVTGVSPNFGGPYREGNLAGVEITGTNLYNATAVHFGGLSTTFRSVDAHTVEATIPTGGHGILDITVTNPSGTSEASSADRFEYETSPEYGRCLKGPIGGDYSDRGCGIEGERSTPYVWYPAAWGSHPLEHAGVEIGSGTFKLETAAGAAAPVKLSCTGIAAPGVVSSYDTLAISRLVLSGCSTSKLVTCASSGAAPGEVRSGPLTATLGSARSKKGTGVTALQFAPTGGEQLLAMTCGTHTLAVSGSFVSSASKLWSMATVFKLAAKEKGGVAELTGLEGQTPASLGVVLDGGSQQPAAVKLKATQTNEEPIEMRG
jgi:alpha-tubulin suppressor-like RCC1 family protein